MKRREIELERKRENSRERSIWEEIVHRETRVLKVRRGVADAGIADAGFSDAGIADAGFSDAGIADAGFASR